MTNLSEQEMAQHATDQGYSVRVWRRPEPDQDTISIDDTASDRGVDIKGPVNAATMDAILHALFKP
jgi:hypothetical protein